MTIATSEQARERLEEARAATNEGGVMSDYAAIREADEIMREQGERIEETMAHIREQSERHHRQRIEADLLASLVIGKYVAMCDPEERQKAIKAARRLAQEYLKAYEGGS